ncbi:MULTISPECIES: DUF6879 family protein [Streptomyces]|uniref:DUF6879 domain-containing protein n=1 Tax=Streptomyces lonegramiae TaxID=3075524 RepID=A0ABU2XTU2_9ACTN|nr:DUF6879 family protein [Streptomyces sp. DSM 41529]MDT0548882.1 hypothetical protein [Streptomyces sp. DSM 41529]
MLGLDSLRLDTSRGAPLDLDSYRRDFRQRQWTIDGQDSWKLERCQHFREPGFASWEAFDRGDWHGALRLIQEERDYLREFSEENERRGITLFRVRVVQEPLTPYLQWELHLLRLRAECGERIRVVSPERVRFLEKEAPLPELLTLGERAVYEIRYTQQGVLDGAIHYSDTETTDRCRAFIRDLYDSGEDLIPYFDENTRHLPPPHME